MSNAEFSWRSERAHVILLRQAQEQISLGIYKSYADVLRGTLAYLDRFGLPAQLPDVDFVSYRAGMQAAVASEGQLLAPVYRSHHIRPRLSLYRVDVDSGAADARTNVTVMYTNTLLGVERVITNGFNEAQVKLLLDHVVELDDSGLRPSVVMPEV